MWPLALILGGFLIYNYYKTGKQFAENNKISVHSVKFNLPESAKALFTKLFFDVVVEIDNPTDFGAVTESYSINLFYNGTLIAGATEVKKISLRPNAVTSIQLPVEVSTLALPAAIVNALSKLKSGQSLTVRLKGNVATTMGVLNFDQEKQAAAPFTG